MKAKCIFFLIFLSITTYSQKDFTWNDYVKLCNSNKVDSLPIYIVKSINSLFERYLPKGSEIYVHEKNMCYLLTEHAKPTYTVNVCLNFIPPKVIADSFMYQRTYGIPSEKGYLYFKKILKALNR